MQRLKESEDESRAARRALSDESPGASHESRTQLLSSRKGSVTSIISIDAPARQPSSQRRGSNLGYRGFHSPPPLSTIPDVYFDQDFRLENPRTFDVDSERSDVVPPASMNSAARDAHVVPPRKVLATNAILKEKLSWYMDTVEVHLIDSIAMASIVFSLALSSLRELHSQAAESVEEMKALREDLSVLDKEVVMDGLEVLRKRRRLCNLEILNNSVLMLKRILEGVACSKLLVEQGNSDKALAEIDATEQMMAGDWSGANGDDTLTQVHLLDLREAAALQGVVSDMAILRSRIGKVFEAKVHDILIGDLRHHIQSVTTEEVLLRWEAASLRNKRSQKLDTIEGFQDLGAELVEIIKSREI